jgi:hypothetical protein
LKKKSTFQTTRQNLTELKKTYIQHLHKQVNHITQRVGVSGYNAVFRAIFAGFQPQIGYVNQTTEITGENGIKTFDNEAGCIDISKIWQARSFRPVLSEYVT